MSDTLILSSSSPVFNFDPYRSDVNVQEIELLRLLTRPIMGAGGIIQRAHFSPDGKEMTAAIVPGLKLALTQRALNSKMVANGIAALIKYRIPERGIWVAGTEKILIQSAEWHMNPICGVEILDNESFKLNFESKPGFENIPGAIQELLARLSAGAKSTFWISDPENRSDFVSNYDMEIISERIFIFKLVG